MTEPFTPQNAWDELVHKDDRTSPEEYPDHCLISIEELQDIMSRSRDVSAGNVAPSLQGPVSWRWRPRGATEWIYDPTEEWRKEHEGDIESEPLYAVSQPVSVAQPPVNSNAAECWSIVEQLRAPEGAGVILLCDNPDFNGQPNNAIEICDDWTQWTQRRFTGETMLDCLRAALAARPKVPAVTSTDRGEQT